MTFRKFVVLAAVGCLLVAAVSLAGLDWFGLSDYQVREDGHAWGWVGVALFALSTYPSPFMDKRYGG